MASQLEVLLVARDAGMTAAFNAAGKSAQTLGNEVDKAAKKVEAAGSSASKFSAAAGRIDAAGRNARIGLSAMSQASGILGSNMQGVIGPIMGAADAIGDLAGAAASFGVIGIAVAAAVVAIGVLNQQYKAQHEALVRVISANDNYIRSLQTFATTSAAAAVKVNELVEAMAHLQEAQAGGGGGPFSAANVVYFQNTIADLKGEINLLTTATEDLAIKSEHAASVAAIHTAAENARRAALEAATTATNNLAAATDAYYTNLVKVQGATNTAFHNFVQQNHALVGTGNALDAGATKWDAYNKLMGQRFPITVGVAKSKYEELMASLKDTSGIDAAKAAMERMNAVIKGFVEKAIAVPSFEEHLKRIADGGKDAYENLFRLDAVATGTNPAEYGAGFEALAKQLEGMGYSAAQAAAGIRDFSIFAEHPELVNSGLIDMATVVEDVKKQLLGMAGQANVVREAMKQVWASLDPKQKADLAAAGIDDANEAVSAIIDPAGKAREQVGGLGTALSNIPRTVTSTLNVIKDAATLAIEEFRAVLDKFIADYGSINISINAEATAGSTSSTPTPAPNSPANGGSGGFATGGWIVPPGYSNDTFPVRANLSSNEVMYIHNKDNAGGMGGFYGTLVVLIDGERQRGAKVRMYENHGMFPA